MTITRFSKLFLVVLALALWAGTASAQITASAGAGVSPLAFSYTKGAASPSPQTSTISDPQSTNTNYTKNLTYTGTSGWLNIGGFTGAVGDVLSFSLNTGTAGGLVPGGTYSASIALSGVTDGTVDATIVINLTISSPLSASAPPTLLFYILGGNAAQGPAQGTVTITNSDTSSDQYTLSSSGCSTTSTWLSITSAQASSNPLSLPATVTVPASGTDTLTFKISPPANQTALSSAVTGCQFFIKYNTATITNGTVSPSMNIQKVTASAASAAVTYNKQNQTAGSDAITNISVPTGYLSTTFNLDPSTLPQWLSLVSPSALSGAGVSISAGNSQPVHFNVNTSIAQGMPTGNYTANVGFYTTVPSSLGLELYVPFTIQISNGNSSVTTAPSTTKSVNFTYQAGTPQPTATLYATDEPIPFTVTCSVAQVPNVYTPNSTYANGCSLNGSGSSASNTVNGTAFTWGSAVTATLDPTLFTYPATVGYTVTVTFTYSNLPFAAPSPVVYVYTIVPGQAILAGATGSTITGQPLQPSTMSARTAEYSGSYFNVLVRGTNFYGPKDIQGNSLVPTQVFVGATQLDNTQPSGGSYVVMDQHDLMVTIPVSMIPSVATGATGKLVIGLANQTDPSTPITAAVVTTPLTFSYIPVVYAISSTASYLQPTLGGSPGFLGYIPNFAPYELISIFGANFGFTGTNLPAGTTSASNTLDSYGKFLSALTLGTPSATGAKPVSLTVTFTDLTSSKNNVWSAPVVFANENQINAIVPSGMTSKSGTNLFNVTVSVTSAGTATPSDGYYQIDYVTADPGIFTLASDGAGQAAIINGNGSVNGTVATVDGDTISIYMTGLGVPDSTGADVVPTAQTSVPTACVAINQASPNPGLLQVVNTKAGTWNPGWTSIDGAVLSYDSHHIVEPATPVNGEVNYPPCFVAADTITVTIGSPAGNHYTVTGADGGAGITYAGFVGGSVAGLYQVNVKLANLKTNNSWSVPSTGYPGGGSYPISVSILLNGNTYTSPAGTTILLPN